MKTINLHVLVSEESEGSVWLPGIDVHVDKFDTTVMTGEDGVARFSWSYVGGWDDVVLTVTATDPTGRYATVTREITYSVVEFGSLPLPMFCAILLPEK